MACLKLGSRPDVFRKQGQDWYEQPLISFSISPSMLLCHVYSVWFLMLAVQFVQCFDCLLYL